MPILVEFPLENGDVVLVEVQELEPETGIERAALAPDLPRRAAQTLESAFDKIKPAINAIVTKIRDVGAPDNIEIEFGLKLSAEAGAFFAATGAECNFKVTLKWERK